MHFHICIQAENWTLQKVDQEYLVSSEMWCWRRMENISWTNQVKNDVLHSRGNEYPTHNTKKEG